MPNYLVLIYGNEAAFAEADASVIEDVTRQHIEFAKAHRSALRGGARGMR